MNASILSIGTELSTGQSVDANAAWLADELTLLGFHIVEHVTVGDDVKAIADSISRLLANARIVICTGGLGPTPDDLTREAVARAVGEPIEEHPEALNQVRSFFTRTGREPASSNLRQALSPRGAQVLPNHCGTAPGILFRLGDRILFALPGVPGEMMPMFRESVAPSLPAPETGRARARRCLHCFGVSEARIGEQIDGFMARERNPLVGTSASAGIITIRILASARTADEAAALAQRDAEDIRATLGSCVYGEDHDSLESVVGRLLREQGKTLATAESCTGGLLAKRLTDVPGSSEYFLRGFVTYSDRSKTEELGVPESLLAAHGAVSEPVAIALASGAREVAGSDYALSTTGIAGPTGASDPDKPIGLVFGALADARGSSVLRWQLGSHLQRDAIRERSCSAVLNLLRLRLLGADPR